MAHLIVFLNQHAPHHFCKLHKALYGLKHAPRACFDKLKIVLLHYDFLNYKSDTSLFTYNLQANHCSC